MYHIEGLQQRMVRLLFMAVCTVEPLSTWDQKVNRVGGEILRLRPGVLTAWRPNGYLSIENVFAMIYITTTGTKCQLSGRDLPHVAFRECADLAIRFKDFECMVPLEVITNLTDQPMSNRAVSRRYRAALR